MKIQKNIQNVAKECLLNESEGIKKLVSYIDHTFEDVVKLILVCKGRVVITGIGKSAIVANKLVATFNSTGTPALFMHAAEAIHGDLGMILPSDIVIIISKSGNSAEIKSLLPLIKNMGNDIVAMVGNVTSYLAKNAHYILNATVEKEACPNNLAPTTSTTASLALGDALAVCLLSCREFTSTDFAKFHPGGALGKRLYLKVDELSEENEKPSVSIDTDIKSVIMELTSKRLGATAVLDQAGELVGIITNGDLGRMLKKHDDYQDLKAKDIMSANPKTVAPGEFASKALDMMQKNNITQLIVADDNKFIGFVHMHDLLREGI
ncbi:MAG: SIS domain-containing protein [Cyclobacteriaceae bacterium]